MVGGSLLRWQPNNINFQYWYCLSEGWRAAHYDDDGEFYRIYRKTYNAIHFKIIFKTNTICNVNVTTSLGYSERPFMKIIKQACVDPVKTSIKLCIFFCGFYYFLTGNVSLFNSLASDRFVCKRTITTTNTKRISKSGTRLMSSTNFTETSLSF